MVCLGGRFGLEYIMSERTCSCIQMNGDDGWYLHHPEPAGPPHLPSNWAAMREMNMALLLLGFLSAGISEKEPWRKQHFPGWFGKKAPCLERCRRRDFWISACLLNKNVQMAHFTNYGSVFPDLCVDSDAGSWKIWAGLRKPRNRNQIFPLRFHIFLI